MKSHLLPLLALGLVAPAVPLLTPMSAHAQNATQSQPFLHPLFTDDAVLQRDRPIPVWGWTTPGQSVTVKIADKTATAKADAAGKWMARIGPFAAGGPYTLTVTGAAETTTRTNVMFGDVWLCSGQSNMEMGISMVNDSQKEIAAANYPNIRLFTVPKGTDTTPRTNVNSKWLVCTPANITQGAWGGFSATAYFFGRKLNQELNVPIGLIHSSWGGTIAEAWVSESSLGALPDFTKDIADAKAASATSSLPLEERVNKWLTTYDPTLKANWNTLEGDDSTWKSITNPGTWEGSGNQELSDFDGIALFRRTVDIPADWAGKDLTVSLGNIDDADVSYWNGTQIGTTNGWGDKRQYKVPGAQVKAGRNVIAVRVTDTGGNGGFAGDANEMRLTRDGAAPIAINGTWKYRVSVPIDKAGSMPRPNDPNNPNRVNVLYNAMIAPLEPYGVKGAIWYQGESNAERPEQYSRLLPTLIRDWRKRFDSPLPFYIVQLAGFMAPDETPKNDNWPKLRAAQMKTAQTVERTGIAITTDIGDEKDIHPKDKQDVGLRLALNALAKDYGRKVEYSGPSVKSVSPQGASVAVTFNNAEGGLSLKGADTSRLFAVAGADRNWFWATPRIEGNRVILTSPVVPRPVYVRYAWSNLPRATLYNGANLPAAPFQTLPEAK
ncbi:9-O-acetylesterase [bacterium]|nr:MAG: 9-O-acetylesterase [bacterium]